MKCPSLKRSGIESRHWTPRLLSGLESQQHIPDVVHFIFGLGDSSEEFIFCWYVAILSAHVVNSPSRILFHYHHEPHGAWWTRAKAIPSFELRYHESLPEFLGTKMLRKRAHRADVLRLMILLEEGGIYMDIDTISVRPYASLLDGRRFVIGLQAPEEPPRGRLCNAVMMAAPGSLFVRTWLNAYESHFNSEGWGEASIDLPYQLYEELGSEHCTITPTEMFLWPPWYKAQDIFQDDVPISDHLITLHLWATISAPILETILGFDWADMNPTTLYGRLLHRVRDLASIKVKTEMPDAQSNVTHSFIITSTRSPLPETFLAVD